MNLNIGGTGNGRSYCKYNAKADKWFVRGSDGDDVEIERPTFIIDFANISTGWIKFLEGEAPERVMDPSLQTAAPSPGDGFKRGFVVLVSSPKYFGGTVELSSASIHMSNAVKDVYALYAADKDANPGKLPVIACTGSQAMKDRYGTNYRPTFSVLKWVDRPTDLPDVNPVAPADIWQGSVAAANQPVPPPERKTAADPLF